MSHLELASDLEQVLKGGPAAVDALARNAARPFAPTGPWLGLAEVCGTEAHHAFDEHRPTEGLAWARSGVSLYEQLADDVDDTSTFRTSAMMLRARAIRETGSEAGDGVRDPQRIYAWVREALFASCEEVVALADALRHRPPTDVGSWAAEATPIRTIKNRLNVLEQLDREKLPSDLLEWLAVRAQLL